MVRLTFAAICLVLAMPSFAERTSFSADSLKSQMEGAADDQQRASARLKASRGDTDSLRILNSDDITYKLPNGQYVPGILLPNGKVAPSLSSGLGQRVPACVTTDYRLVPGSYDANKQAIQCNLAAQDLAILQGDVASQVSSSPERKEEAAAETIATSAKYGGGEPPRATTAPTEAKPKPASQAPASRPAPSRAPSTSYSYSPPAAPAADPHTYVPPMRNASSKPRVGAVMTRDENLFGVPIGTWVEAQLLRRVSSAEGGYIEFQTTTDIEGRYQVLPAGTVLFANKQINEASRRLESVSVTARLPDGKEVPGVTFRVHSLDRTAGLTGQLIRDRAGEVANAGSNALLNAAGSIAMNGADQATGGIASDLQGDLVRTEQRNIGRKPKAVIEVAPQNVLLQAMKGF